MVQERVGALRWVAFGIIAGAVSDAATAQESEPDALPVTVSLQFPLGLARHEERLYVSERGAHRVLCLNLGSGRLRVVAGNGSQGFRGDGGPAREAVLFAPDSLAVDGKGNLYIADRGNERIRRIEATTGVIRTVAGNGVRAPSDDGRPATESSLCGPFFVHCGHDEWVYFTDTDCHRIRRFHPDSGVLETLAGNGVGGDAGDGGPARRASFRRPHVAVLLRAGNVLIGDSFNHRLRLLDTERGIVLPYAGTGDEGATEEAERFEDARFRFFGQIVELEDGRLWMTEWGNQRLLELDPEDERIYVLAGSLDEGGPTEDGHAPLDTRFQGLAGLVVDAGGNALVTDARAGTVRRLDFDREVVTTLIGPAAGVADDER